MIGWTNEGMEEPKTAKIPEMHIMPCLCSAYGSYGMIGAGVNGVLPVYLPKVLTYRPWYSFTEHSQ